MKIHFLATAVIFPAVTLAAAEIPPTAPQSIGLASSRKPEISVNGGNLTDGKSKLNFITHAVGQTTANQTLTIDNIGTASLTGLKFVIDGPGKAAFKATTIPKTSLAPNLSTSFQIKFKPTQKKPVTATLHILSNDPDEKSFDIKLEGRIGIIIIPSSF